MFGLFLGILAGCCVLAILYLAGEKPTPAISGVSVFLLLVGGVLLFLAYRL